MYVFFKLPYKFVSSLSLLLSEPQPIFHEYSNCKVTETQEVMTILWQFSFSDEGKRRKPHNALTIFPIVIMMRALAHWPHLAETRKYACTWFILLCKVGHESGLRTVRHENKHGNGREKACPSIWPLHHCHPTWLWGILIYLSRD